MATAFHLSALTFHLSLGSWGLGRVKPAIDWQSQAVQHPGGIAE